MLDLFLNTQYTEKKDRVAAVPLFAEYQKETADMTNEQAQECLTDQLNTLSNFQFVQIALNGEVDEGLLQGLVEENPNILEEYRQAGYEERSTGAYDKNTGNIRTSWTISKCQRVSGVFGIHSGTV